MKEEPEAGTQGGKFRYTIPASNAKGLPQAFLALVRDSLRPFYEQKENLKMVGAKNVCIFWRHITWKHNQCFSDVPFSD